MTTMVLGQDQLRIQDLVQNPALNHIQDPAQDHVRDQDLGLGHGIQEIDQGQEVEAVHAVDAAPDLVAGQGHILTPRKGEGPDLALAVHITTGTEDQGVSHLFPPGSVTLGVGIIQKRATVLEFLD